MCRKLIAFHVCKHKFAKIEQCMDIINQNRAASAVWKWKKVTPLPSCPIVRTDVPDDGYHYILTSFCPPCIKRYGPDADLDLIWGTEAKELEDMAQRCRLAKEIQQGKYVLPPPSTTTPQPQASPQQSSARPTVKSKFTELGMTSNPATPNGSRPSTLTRNHAVRSRSSSNTVQQVRSSTRPAYGHRRMESKDLADMGLDDIGSKYTSYYRSGANSSMPFEHPDVAAYNGSMHSQQSSRRAYDMGDRLNKPLPLTPPNEREPIVSVASTSKSRPSIRRKAVPTSSYGQPPPKSQQHEQLRATRFEADRVHAQRLHRSPERPTIKIPFQARLGEPSPISDRLADREKWASDQAEWDGLPDDNARACIKPGAKRPQAPRILENRLQFLEGVGSLEALSALTMESEADDYFVPFHANTGKAKGRIPVSSYDEVSPMTRQPPRVTATSTRKSDRLEPPSLLQSIDSTSRTGERRFLPRWSSLTEPMQAEYVDSPDASELAAQSSCPWADPNPITGSPPLLSSAVYSPPPMPAPRDPTDDIPDEVDDAIDFEAIEYRINVMAAAAEVRSRVEKWQGSSNPTSWTHSRTHSTEQNMVQTPSGSHLLPPSLQIRMPTLLNMRDPAPDGKGGFFDKGEER